MAKQIKSKQKRSVNRKLIAGLSLTVVLVLTLIFVFLGVTGRNLDSQGLYKLLPWLPTPGQKSLWRQALMPGAALGDTQVMTFVPQTEEAVTPEMLEDAAAVLAKRTKDMGWVDASVAVKDNQVIVTLPKAADVGQAEKLLSMQGKFAFSDPQGNVFLESDAIVASGFGYADNTGKNFALSFEFNSEGKKIFGEKSTELMGQSIGIVRDGITLVTPSISEPLTEGMVSVPGFSLEDARDNAVLLRSGTLPFAMTLSAPVAEAYPLYGENVEKTLLIALLVFFLAILLYFVITYRLAGLTAAWMLLIQLTLAFFLSALIRSGFTVMTLWAVYASFLVTTFGLNNLLGSVRGDLLRGRAVRQALRDSYAGRGHASLDVFAALIFINVILIIADKGIIKVFAQIFALGLLAGAVVLHLLYRLTLNEVIHLAGSKTGLYAMVPADRKEA
jgi:preprotein translocase subunit SecD